MRQQKREARELLFSFSRELMGGLDAFLSICGGLSSVSSFYVGLSSFCMSSPISIESERGAGRNWQSPKKKSISPYSEEYDFKENNLGKIV